MLNAGRWAGGTAAAWEVLVVVLCEEARAWERAGLPEVEPDIGVPGGLGAEDGAFETGGRRVVAAVRAVAVLFARAWPRVRGLVAVVVEDGRPPEDVGRGVLPEGLLLFTLVLADVWFAGAWRIDGALPSAFGGAFSVAVGLVRRVVPVVGGLLEKMPDRGLPDAVVVLVALLAALLRAAADAEVAPVVVPDRVKGLIWGSRLGELAPGSPLVAAASFWAS